jgi:hypothetical protein
MHEGTVTLKVRLPLLPGSISTARSTRGKANCACKRKPPKLHGPYYRWTGFIDRKRTIRTLSAEQGRQCRERIRNYRALEKQLPRLLLDALERAPWNQQRPQPQNPPSQGFEQPPKLDVKSAYLPRSGTTARIYRLSFIIAEVLPDCRM